MSHSNNNVWALTHKQRQFDPDSNLYIAGLPRHFNKEKLYELFSPYGLIHRFKFVLPKDDANCPRLPYGFVQFSHSTYAQHAIQELNGRIVDNYGPIEVSIAAVGRRVPFKSSEEPTNLYIENLPSTWNNDTLSTTFGKFGSIRQSKITGSNVAFVRFESHEEALNAINHMHREMIAPNKRLTVRFATCQHKKGHRCCAPPTEPTESSAKANGNGNENNLYIKNLPKAYNQMRLECLFAQFGPISSATIINDSIGVAFVRYKHAEDARKAIRRLNGTTPPLFEKEIVVKMAHSDIEPSNDYHNCSYYKYHKRVTLIVKGYTRTHEQVLSHDIVDIISHYYYFILKEDDEDVEEECEPFLERMDTLDDRLQYVEHHIYDIQMNINHMWCEAAQKRMSKIHTMENQFQGVIARLYQQMNDELQSVARILHDNQQKESLRIKMLEGQVYALNTEREKQKEDIYKMQQQINGLLYNDILPQNERVRIWLTETVGLEQYHDILVQNGYDDMENIADITQMDLMNIGIEKIGHRKKIIKYASKIPKRLYSVPEIKVNSPQDVHEQSNWICDNCRNYNVAKSNQCTLCGHSIENKIVTDHLPLLSN
eukprot:257838_1